MHGALVVNAIPRTSSTRFSVSLSASSSSAVRPRVFKNARKALWKEQGV